MKLYGGIDLHSNNSVIHIIDDKGNSQFKKKVSNDLAIRGTVYQSTWRLLNT